MINKKLKIALAFTIVTGILIWLLVSGFNENMQYYQTIEELKSAETTVYTQGLRVKGNLVPGSLLTNPNSLAVSFRIIESGLEMDVRYHGILPDTFKEGSEVLVEGKYTPEGYFDAKTVMAKCPSKYESADDYNNNTGLYKPNDANKTEGTY